MNRVPLAGVAQQQQILASLIVVLVVIVVDNQPQKQGPSNPLLPLLQFPQLLLVLPGSRDGVGTFVHDGLIVQSELPSTSTVVFVRDAVPRFSFAVIAAKGDVENHQGGEQDRHHDLTILVFIVIHYIIIVFVVVVFVDILGWCRSVVVRRGGGEERCVVAIGK